MAIQQYLVFAIVLASSIYAAWAVMPAAWRKAIATQLLRRGQPAWLHGALQAAAANTGGCGSCGGCSPAAGAKPSGVGACTPTTAPGAPRVIRLYPQSKR